MCSRKIMDTSVQICSLRSGVDSCHGDSGREHRAYSVVERW